ncbi:hypothetical protein KKA47_06965 [bacterium]|nr:hypothetical protein [bacterium]
MAKDKEIAAGAEILSFCGKCKLPLAHTVIAMKKNGAIGKCECKTCGAVHLYRDPDKPKRAPSAKTKESKEENAALAWSDAIAGVSGAPKAYSMTSEFAIGDLIAHPTFGKGVVGGLIDSNKIRMVFEGGEKILMHKQ